MSILRRLGIGSGLILVSIVGTVATIELTISNAEKEAEKEKNEWIETFLPMRLQAEEILKQSNLSDPKILELNKVLERVDGMEAQWRNHHDDVVDLKVSWAETKSKVAVFWS